MKKLIGINSGYLNSHVPMTNSFLLSQDIPLCFQNENFEYQMFPMAGEYLEKSNENKHLTTYFTVENENGEILIFDKIKQGDESCSHNKKTVLVGSHVIEDDLYWAKMRANVKYYSGNFIDGDKINIFSEMNKICLKRKFEELLKMNNWIKTHNEPVNNTMSFLFSLYQENRKSDIKFLANFLGFINDENDEVDKMHFCSVYKIKIPNKYIEEYFGTIVKRVNVEYLDIRKCLEDFDNYDTLSKKIILNNKIIRDNKIIRNDILEESKTKIDIPFGQVLPYIYR